MSTTDILNGIKLVIFDVDGVIFDIIDAIRETVKEGIDKYKLKGELQEAMQEIFPLLEIAQCTPIPELILNSKELFNVKLLEGMTVLKKLRIAASFYGNYRDRKDNCELFEGIEDVIKGLSKRGIKLAILSNNKRTYVIESLEKQHLDKYFENILGFNEVSNVKPDPVGLLKILELENVKPEEALFIGDMITDLQAGEKAKIPTIAVASGLTAREKLEQEKPFKIVDNILELRKLLAV